MKKASAIKLVRELSEGPSVHRRQHTPFTRDILTPPGAPVVARHRTRSPLTPFEVRQEILSDIAEKPEAVRLRSLRRRLTALDRALSDHEAQALERLTGCMIALTGVSCLNLVQAQVKGSPQGRLPFGERKRREIAAMTVVMNRLSPANRRAISTLAEKLNPSHSCPECKPSPEEIKTLTAAAAQAAEIYAALARDTQISARQT